MQSYHYFLDWPSFSSFIFKQNNNQPILVFIKPIKQLENPSPNAPKKGIPKQRLLLFYLNLFSMIISLSTYAQRTHSSHIHKLHKHLPAKKKYP